MSGLFENMLFDEIVEYTINRFAQENGRDKVVKLYEKVMTSDRLSGLISTSRFRGLAPNSVDVLSTMCEMPYFMFRSNFTQVCAAAIFFKRWDEEVNSQLHLVSEDVLKHHLIACYNKYHIF